MVFLPLSLGAWGQAEAEAEAETAAEITRLNRELEAQLGGFIPEEAQAAEQALAADQADLRRRGAKAETRRSEGLRFNARLAALIQAWRASGQPGSLRAQTQALTRRSREERDLAADPAPGAGPRPGHPRLPPRRIPGP